MQAFLGLCLCGLHLLIALTLPYGARVGRQVLQRPSTSRRVRSAVSALLRRASGAYSAGTVALGVAVVVLWPPDLGDQGPGPLWAWLPAAAALGAGLPLAALYLSGNAWTVERTRPGTGAFLALTACAVAEEVLWRALAPAALEGLGLPPVLAHLTAGAGFVALHLGSAGLRRLPYHAVLAVVLTALFLGGGLLACALAHVLHNAVLSRIHRSPKRQGRPPATPAPSARDW